ncbi:MAG: AraC family transcriptional regulator, partial [Propionivibrio sp.]
MSKRSEQTEKFKANLEIVHPAPESAFTSIVHPWPWPQCVWHHHKEFEIHLILNASGQLWVGDYIGPFRHGHLVLVGPDLPHNWTSHSIAPPDQPAQEDHVVQFDIDSFGKGFFEIPDLAEIYTLLKRSARGIEFLDYDETVVDLIFQLGSSKGVGRFVCLLQILQKLARVTDYRVLCSEAYSPILGDNAVMRINKILSYMRLNLANELTLEAACAYLHMQPRSFSRFFRQITGRRFSDYLCEMRIGEACSLLLNTDRPITDICFAVGFSNISWFNRCFLEIKGITPREFRRAGSARYGPFDQRGQASEKNLKVSA